MNNASWKLTDIHYTTPLLCATFLTTKAKYLPFDMNPKIVIIDEFDDIINRPEMSVHLFKVLDYLGNVSGEEKKGRFSMEVNKHRQFIFCGSTMPKEFYNQS